MGWHTSLSKQQTKSLEDIQRRALHFIISNIPYDEACSRMNLASLDDQRLSLCLTLFSQIAANESHILHFLLPAKQDVELISRLRSTRTFPTVRTRTNHFKYSFIMPHP